jgi:hypothetical protein
MGLQGERPIYLFSLKFLTIRGIF